MAVAGMMEGKAVIVTGAGGGIGRGRRTPETIAQQAIPAMRAAFMPLDTSEQAFPWDPV
jgi:FlaA1/EpsC-like NDP-sugar epimerase